MSALGEQMKARYERVKRRFANFDQTIGEAMDMLAPRSLSVSSTRRQIRRENDMPRYSNTPDRDEQGRFLPEHDREYSRGGYRGGQERDESCPSTSEGGRRSRGRYEEDEGNGGGRHSMSRGRYENDDDRYSGRGEDRGHGGWFGDSEGHSEASRRG